MLSSIFSVCIYILKETMGGHHFMHSHKHHHNHGMFHAHSVMEHIHGHNHHRHHFGQKGGFSLSSVAHLAGKIPAPVWGALTTGAVGLGTHYIMNRMNDKNKCAMEHVAPFMPTNIRLAHQDWKSSNPLHDHMSKHNGHEQTLRDITEPLGPKHQMKTQTSAIYHPENRVEKMHNGIVDKLNDAPARIHGSFGGPARSWLDE